MSNVWRETLDLISKSELDCNSHPIGNGNHGQHIAETQNSDLNLYDNTQDKGSQSGVFQKVDFLKFHLEQAFLLDPSHIAYFDQNDFVSLLNNMTSNQTIVLNSINTYWFFCKASKLWDFFAKSKIQTISHLTKQHLYNNLMFPAIQIGDKLWLTIRCENTYKKLKLCQFNLLSDEIRSKILCLCQYKDKQLYEFGLTKKHLLQGLYYANLPKYCPLCKQKFKFDPSSHICTKFRKNDWTKSLSASDHKTVHYSQCTNNLCTYFPHSSAKMILTQYFDLDVLPEIKSKISNILDTLPPESLSWIKVKPVHHFNSIVKEIISYMKLTNMPIIYHFCNHIFNLHKCTCFLSILKCPNILNSQAMSSSQYSCLNRNQQYDFICNNSSVQKIIPHNIFILAFQPRESISLQAKIIKRNLQKLGKVGKSVNVNILVISKYIDLQNVNVDNVIFDDV